MQELKLSRKGFTILEVLIAFVLVGTAVVAVMETFGRGFSGTGEVENYSLALSLAQERLEEIKNTAFASVVSDASPQNVPGYSSTFTRQVSVVTNDNSTPCGNSVDLKRVTVMTFWTVPKGQTSVNLTTCIVNNP